MALNERQALFALEYTVDLNATQAATRAGYSKRTAYSQGQRLLKSPEVQEKIQSLMDKRAEKTGITAEMVLKEYARMAFCDVRKLFREDGKPKDITELDDDTAACISGLDVQDVYSGYGANREFIGYIKKYKLADKKAALDSIARHLGMFTDRIEHSGDIEVNLKGPLKEWSK